MHRHVSAPERHWLPAHNHLLAPHPSCRVCGLVKNLSPDRARKIGYFVNVLSEMRKHRGGKLLSDAQVRLILLELQKVDNFEDDYYVTFQAQKSVFVNAVRKYSSLSPGFVESFLT